ncbi:phytanoyl-CoA dioxygenase family protein [Leptothoe spongobia]|uniref:Phytanoyl-CoA dioxygenase family protein n=1 Tax=Leptothoe spongobia TAU-MAC 1115 TaxID=1967444 RepID=A0A947GM19_9CYAN|nr:phytanoyl-CoA dioxygenase family protein [Leptothoe spongobia]MBT9317713.1 phytanoyl-CoA dioxygenase family protein [Leptothoe spongobia TAU-MAC 1115]
MYSLSREQIQQYHDDGFLVIPGLFDPDELTPLEQACQADPSIKNAQTSVTWDDGRVFKLIYWTDLGSSMLGVLPRINRLVNAVESLLGEECYHWHSKIVRKLPGEGSNPMHQDYSTWYNDGCLYPNMLSCAIAISKSTQESGCLKVAKGSHRLARLDNQSQGNSVVSQQHLVEHALQNHEIIYCEQEPGDVVFFHGKTIHGGDENSSNYARNLFYSSYNTISNEPWRLEGQEHHRYKPLIKVSDTALKERNYTSVLFEEDELPPVESEASRSNFAIRTK